MFSSCTLSFQLTRRQKCLEFGRTKDLPLFCHSFELSFSFVPVQWRIAVENLLNWEARVFAFRAIDSFRAVSGLCLWETRKKDYGVKRSELERIWSCLLPCLFPRSIHVRRKGVLFANLFFFFLFVASKNNLRTNLYVLGSDVSDANTP